MIVPIISILCMYDTYTLARPVFRRLGEISKRKGSRNYAKYN